MLRKGQPHLFGAEVNTPLHEQFHVLHIIVGLERGGAEGALYQLCTSAPSGVRMSVISLKGDGFYGPKLRDAGAKVIALRMRSLLSLPMALWRLCWLLRAQRPNVIQTWMYHADLVGGLVGKMASVPVCWGIRTSNLERTEKASTKFVAKLCGVLSRILPAHAISCSQRAVIAHRSFGYRVPMTVVPNGYDFTRWTAATSSPYRRLDFQLDDDHIVIAHAARANPVKDHAGLARAFNMAYRENQRLRLLLCGRGLEANSDYVAALPFTADARTAVLPLGPREDLPMLWGIADFFVLSSVTEGFPNVVVEAMASRLPVVVTDVGDAALIVGDTGLVVPHSDSNALATALLRMAALTRDRRRVLGVAAAARVKERYTVDRTVDGFMSVWCSVVSGSRS